MTGKNDLAGPSVFLTQNPLPAESIKSASPAQLFKLRGTVLQRCSLSEIFSLFIMKYFQVFRMLFLAFLYYLAAAGAQLERDGKQSIFQIVRFPNEVCASSSGLNGTCYTSSECESLGGSSSGSFASSFGVCCVFSLSCGGSSSQNNTYATVTSYTVREALNKNVTHLPPLTFVSSFNMTNSGIPLQMSHFFWKGFI